MGRKGEKLICWETVFKGQNVFGKLNEQWENPWTCGRYAVVEGRWLCETIKIRKITLPVQTLASYCHCLWKKTMLRYIMAHIRFFYKHLKILCPSKNFFKSILHLSKMARRPSAKDNIPEFSWPICMRGFFLTAASHSALEPQGWESRKKSAWFLSPISFLQSQCFSRLPENLEHLCLLCFC